MKVHRLTVVFLVLCATVWPATIFPQDKRPTTRKQLLGDVKNGHIEIKPEKKSQPVKKTAAKVTPEARALLDQVTAAYTQIQTLELSGTLTGDFEAGDQKRHETATLTAMFEAPNRFRHEIKGDVVVGSTGKIIYAYRPQRNQYSSSTAPGQRVPSAKLPQPMRGLLEMQDPGLMAAIVEDTSAWLAEDCLEVSRAGDGLEFKGDRINYRVQVDPQTHLIRRIELDMRRQIESSGRPDVKRASLVFEYTVVRPGAKLPQDAFAWQIPEGAREITASLADDDDEDRAVSLVGQQAPQFTLKDLEGKRISLADHKGAVVVLDFWATWCGPCRASLPALSKLYADLRSQGLVVYAIDLEEARDKVRAVASELKLEMPVLLDATSEVARKYGVQSIPCTVVIGKNGTVRKVIIGGGNEQRIRAAAEAELGENK